MINKNDPNFLFSAKAITLMAIYGGQVLSPQDLFILIEKALGDALFAREGGVYSHVRLLEEQGLLELTRGKDRSGARRSCYRLTSRGNFLFEYMQQAKQQLKRGDTQLISMEKENFTRKEIFGTIPFRQVFLLCVNEGITSIPATIERMGQIFGKGYKPDIGSAGTTIKPLVEKEMITPIPDSGYSLYGHYAITEAGKAFLRESEKIELRLLNPRLLD